MSEQSLEGLIATLQEATRSGGIPTELLAQATATLAGLGHRYNEARYPALGKTAHFKDASKDAPSNLAEALLWKLGKWQAYKNFAAACATGEPEVVKDGVVFLAFARHLRDKSHPIFDQHALRALWAIDSTLTRDEQEQCKSFLFSKSGAAKKNGDGKNSVACYELFVEHIKTLVPLRGDDALGEIDRLLMPLGKAIKKSTDTYAKFQALCGRPAPSGEKAKR